MIHHCSHFQSWQMRSLLDTRFVTIENTKYNQRDVACLWEISHIWLIYSILNEVPNWESRGNSSDLDFLVFRYIWKNTSKCPSGKVWPGEIQLGQSATKWLPRPKEFWLARGCRPAKAGSDVVTLGNSSLFRPVASLYQWFGWQQRKHFTECMGVSKMAFTDEVNAK